MILCPKQPIKNSNEFKNPMTPDPVISNAKVLPAKGSNKGYGDKNSCNCQDPKVVSYSET